MALEDALAVAQALPAADLSIAALRAGHARYVRLREGRVRRVQLDSRRLGRVAGLGLPGLPGLRNLVARLVPDAVSARHYRRLVQPGLELAAVERARSSVLGEGPTSHLCREV